MITIKIKTPADYWWQLKEWVKSPRQRQCKDIAIFYHYLICAELEKNENDYLQDFDHNTRRLTIACIDKLNNVVLNRVNRFVEENYPKYNLPK